VLFGLLVDAQHAYNLAWLLVAVVFGATVVVVLGWRRAISGAAAIRTA
jgi:hypothetical protein